MEIRKLNAARGWVWIKQGYQLILRNPLLSISTSLIGTLGIFLALMVPLFGPLLAISLMPVLLAGYMRICRALEEEEEVELAHLFAGFQKHTASLVSLGAFLMMGLLLVSAIMVYIGGDAFAKLMEEAQATNNPQVLMEAISTAGSGVAFAIMLGFALVLIMIVAWQYAPILVFFSGVPPLFALRASFTGTMRNILPYTVYSLIMQVLALLLGILPFGIGMILLLPLGLTSLYVSYRNIFPWLDEPMTKPVGENNSAESEE
jgi:uncharacterized membrane protein